MLVSCESIATKKRTGPPDRPTGICGGDGGDSVNGRVFLINEGEARDASPVHSHANEQWGACLEGEWIRIQDGVEHHVKAGDFWQTPPHVPHGGRTLGARCVVLDIFAPPREEYRGAGSGLGDATLAGRP
ncbi:MAG TPA: cupin domain-containing protein [Methylomirabilota bacterium]|nr:cupin domain-containing protein [Methylomirabilota bacterium]